MIKTFTGPMFASKSEHLIKKYKSIYNKDNILAFKPRCDDRDLGVIRSRNVKEEIPAICIDDLSEILSFIKPETRTIFIDEAEMLKGNVSVLSKLSIIDDIDIYTAGLNQTSEQQPFGIMPYILAISDDIEVVKASCFMCGREDATFSFYKGVKTEEIVVGSDEYMPLCGRCLRLKRTRKDIK